MRKNCNKFYISIAEEAKTNSFVTSAFINRNIINYEVS